MAEPLFTVVVPTCNRNDLLERCLALLAPGVQTLPAEQYEVIVTDDGAARSGRLLLEQHPWANYVEGPMRGPAANRNCGAKRASGAWIAFTDDDCLPDPGWLASFADGMRLHPEQLVFEGRIYADRPRASLAEIAPVNESGGYLWSSNFAVQRDLFAQLGGFDARFRVAMEDVDFRFRLEQLGHRALFLKNAAVCHPWRERRHSGDGWKQLSGYMEDTLRYLAIHREEAARLSARYFLLSALRGLLKVTLPGLVNFRGRGLVTAIANHLTEMRLAREIWRGTPERMRAELR